MNQPPSNCEMDELQRMGLDYNDNYCCACKHAVQVRIGKEWYTVCIQKHDEKGTDDAVVVYEEETCELWEEA